MVQDIWHIQQQMKKMIPGWMTQGDCYREEVRKYVHPDCVILDIGCGRTGYMCEIYTQAARVIGLDPDETAILEHPCLTEKLVGDVPAMGILKDSSVDMAVSCWALEHIEKPASLFKEVFRILKPGGVFIALTPNKLSIPAFLSRIIPNKAHPWIIRKLFGRLEKDTYPTYYRINTPNEITKMAYSSGFSEVSIKKIRDASHFIISPKMIRLTYILHTALVPTSLSEGLLIRLTK